jgi:ABC-type uncharacterized transport system auxiliary subunit
MGGGRSATALFLPALFRLLLVGAARGVDYPNSTFVLKQEETMDDRSKRRSRRRFLWKALAATAALTTKPALAHPSNPERERLTRLLAKYGSELGNLRRVVEGRE